MSGYSAHVRVFPDLTCVMPYLRGRYDLLDMSAEVCSNGVPGVERDGACCEAQCGTCGGAGCRSRPGGSVSWFMLLPLGLNACATIRSTSWFKLITPNSVTRHECRIQQLLECHIFSAIKTAMNS